MVNCENCGAKFTCWMGLTQLITFRFKSNGNRLSSSSVLIISLGF